MSYADLYEKGRQAFEENRSISDYPNHYDKTQHKAWKDGYLEAKRQHEAEKEAEQWHDFSSNCPWHEKGIGWCKALSGEDDNECTRNNCAPLYFKENHS